MTARRWLAALALLAAVPLACAAADFRWPAGIRAAVSLAYDDALDSQLDQAIPALDRHGLKGSFYLQLSQPSVRLRMNEWRAAAARGHELGNHTLFHQCSHSLPGRDWVPPQRDLDHTSVAQVLDQVRVANTMLYAIDGQRERTFTAPCGDLLASGVNYLPAIRSEFVAIKAGSGSGVLPAMATLDPYRVPVAAPVGLTGQQLIAIVEQAGAQGTMVNFTFHGIGGDYLSNSVQAHDELLAFLAAHRATYWTDTFLAVMTHVKREREHSAAH